MREKKVYIRPEDSLEFVYEIMDKYKDTGSADEAIEKLKRDMRKMIRYFKEEKFEKLQREFGVEP
ncbi:MAG: hypothetical protein DRN07_05075 [Thermoplasmata archaeon]|nr:MAG: hypothetical protein DRN07_05075 [Thermoplasmata archaeon]